MTCVRKLALIYFYGAVFTAHGEPISWIVLIKRTRKYKIKCVHFYSLIVLFFFLPHVRVYFRPLSFRFSAYTRVRLPLPLPPAFFSRAELELPYSSREKERDPSFLLIPPTSLCFSRGRIFHLVATPQTRLEINTAATAMLQRRGRKGGRVVVVEARKKLWKKRGQGEGDADGKGEESDARIGAR